MTPQEGHTYLLTLESWSPFKTLKKKKKRKKTALEKVRTCTQNLDIISKYSQVSADVTTHAHVGTQTWGQRSARGNSAVTPHSGGHTQRVTQA